MNIVENDGKNDEYQTKNRSKKRIPLPPSRKLPEQKTGETRTNCRQEFWRVANAAIAAGTITEKEVNLICRPGSRKSGYWCRHLRNINDLLERAKTVVDKSETHYNGDVESENA